jgi:hypothetical protein
MPLSYYDLAGKSLLDTPHNATALPHIYEEIREVIIARRDDVALQAQGDCPRWHMLEFLH